jgi:hypothetical protein
MRNVEHLLWGALVGVIAFAILIAAAALGGCKPAQVADEAKLAACVESKLEAGETDPAQIAIECAAEDIGTVANLIGTLNRAGMRAACGRVPADDGGK